MESNTIPSGYVLQLYQFAIRYDYNNKSLLNYFNKSINNSDYNSSDDEDFITLGSFDLVEINPVTSFRQYHDVSKFAKRWIGKRQCILLYDISTADTPTRLYYTKDIVSESTDTSPSPITKNLKRTHYWESNYSEYHEIKNKRFFCLSMLSLTNDILSIAKENAELLHQVREKILNIIDDINKSIGNVDIACDVFGTFNTSEIAVICLSDQYADVILALEYLKHLFIEDAQGTPHNIIMTTFSVISMRSDLIPEELDGVQGDALLQLSFNDESYSYNDLENVKKELLRFCVDSEGNQAKNYSSTGEYDWELLCSARSVLDLILPYNNKSCLLQIGIRDKDKGGLYENQKIRTILRNNTRLLIGSGENKELKARLNSYVGTDKYVIRDVTLQTSEQLPVEENGYDLLEVSRNLYFKKVRDDIKKKVNASTGTVDTLDLLITDYQSVIATAYSKTWVEDIHTQFYGVMQSIEKLVDTEKTSSVKFWDGYRDLTNAFKQQVYHLTQSSRMFFETPSSHLRATGQYDFLMHAYYGITKHIIESIYMLQEVDKQSELIPLITVNTEPQVTSELFYEYKKDDARIINLIIPNSVITDPYRGIFYLCHELNHYSVPINRVERNYRLGVFALSRIFKNQILSTFKKIMFENCTDELRSSLDVLLDFSKSDKIFLRPANEGVDSFDRALMSFLLSKEYYAIVDNYVTKFDDCQGGRDALKTAYLKLIEEFSTTDASDELFSKLFFALFQYLSYAFKLYYNANSKDVSNDAAFKWINSRFTYYDLLNSYSGKSNLLLEKAVQYRKLERRQIINDSSRRNNSALEAINLCKAIDEARSDIASITLTGYTLTDYILFFIKNSCDLTRENNPEKITIDNSQQLRFSLVLDYCLRESVDNSFCCKGNPERNTNPILQGKNQEYFLKVLPWVFLGMDGAFSDKTKTLTKATTYEYYAQNWTNKIEDIFTSYITEMRIYYQDIFKPILDSTNIAIRYNQLISRNDERAVTLSEIQKLFNKSIHDYSDFRNRLLKIKDLCDNAYFDIIKDRFNLDLSIIQRFQNQKSLFQLEKINTKISSEQQSKHEKKRKNISYIEFPHCFDYLDPRQHGNNVNDRRFLIYSWNELQFYLEYCRRAFRKQLDKLGFKGNMYSQIWYRGQTTIDEKNYKLWPLSYRAFHPTIRGNEKPDELEKIWEKKNTYKSYCRYQRSQFEYFKTLADGAPEAPDYGTLTLCDYIALMQHYGLETNLLDFTDNAFIALYLALKYFSNEEKKESKQRDVAIYLFNPFIYNLFRQKKMQADININAGGGNQHINNYKSKILYGLESEDSLNSPIPNLSVSRNEKTYARYILGSDILDYEASKDSNRIKALPIAVWTPRINNRIRTQMGSFVAFDLYADVNDESCNLMDLQDEEIKKANDEGYEPYIFLYRIGVAKESCPNIYNTLNIMGMNRQYVYPELDKTLNRFK